MSTATTTGPLYDAQDKAMRIAYAYSQDRQSAAELVQTMIDGAVQDRCEEMLSAIEQLECPDCGHALKFHADKYNCEVERGDGYRVGSEILEALGPCGCDCTDCPDLLPLIAILRKARGE